MPTLLHWQLALVLSLCLAFKAAAQTDSPSCVSLDELIANTNGAELNCVRQENCMGVQCANVDQQLQLLIELTRISLLPCASGTPAVLLELLGAVDPSTQRRPVVFSGELRSDTVIPLEFNDVPFGNFNVTFDPMPQEDTIGFALRRQEEGAMSPIQLISYTNLTLDFSPCTQPDTTEMPTTTSTSTTSNSQSNFLSLSALLLVLFTLTLTT